MSSAGQFHLTGDFHLTDGQLLLHCDGGPNAVDSRPAASHLELCTSCRARLEGLTAEVDAFLLFRSRFFLPALPSPPHAWPDLSGQFERLDHPWRAKFDSALDGFLHMCRGLRYNMVAAAALLILIFLIFQPWQATVSAAKLLARAIAAQSAVLRSTKEPVVHHKLRIQFHSAAQDSHTLLDYESWRDFRNGRFGEAISSGASDSSDKCMNDLRRVYAANHLDWQSPLSAEAYERWSATLVGGRASVARGHGDSSGAAPWLILTTFATPNPQGDEIGKAQLVVRRSDWHPVSVRLSLKDREYEISEVVFQVVPLAQFDSSLFDDTIPGADQASSPARQNSLSDVHAGRTAGREQRSRQTGLSANAPPAALAVPSQGQPGTSHAPTSRATRSTAGDQDAAETSDAGASMDLPITLSSPVSTPADLAPAGPRLNFGLPTAPAALNPGMALAEQIARQQELMRTTQQRPSKVAAPSPATPRQKVKGKNTPKPGK
jgi:hypothetical protein